MDDVDAWQLDGQGLALAARLLLVDAGGGVGRPLGGRRQLRGVTTGLGGRFSQCFGLVEEPGLARVRFAAGPEHAPTRQAQLFVELEDAGLEGFLQFGLTRLDGGFLLEPKPLELGCKLRLEGPLLCQQQGFEHRRIVGQLLGMDDRAHAAGGIREMVGSALWHAGIIPDHAT